MIFENKNRVAVLLATYNGERFIREQLDSLLAQTFSDFTVYVSDDGSSDATLLIIEECQAQNTGKIAFVNKEERKGGACANFLFLLESVDSELYMFCDQDDVWHKDKIQKTVEMYNSIGGTGAPVLIHSDVTVVDENLNVISESVFHYSDLQKKLTWKGYLVENNVMGCTALINRELANLYKASAAKLDKGLIFMHDIFFAQIASLLGDIYLIDEPLMLYRQHEANRLGAGEVTYSAGLFAKKLATLRDSSQQLKTHQMEISALLQLDCMKQIDERTFRILQGWASLYEKNGLQRVLFVLKHGILRRNWTKNILLILKLLVERKR